MNNKGVTLVELLVVFIIIAIGALLLAPNLGGFLTSYRLRTAARDVASAMRTAQMRAVSTNSIYGVGFGANNCQLYRLLRTSGGLVISDGTEGAPSNLPKGVSFANNNFPPNASLGMPCAQFNPDNTASAGGVTLQGKKGSRRITVTSATGRVRIE